MPATPGRLTRFVSQQMDRLPPCPLCAPSLSVLHLIIHLLFISEMGPQHAGRNLHAPVSIIALDILPPADHRPPIVYSRAEQTHKQRRHVAALADDMHASRPRLRAHARGSVQAEHPWRVSEPGVYDAAYAETVIHLAGAGGHVQRRYSAGTQYLGNEAFRDVVEVHSRPRGCLQGHLYAQSIDTSVSPYHKVSREARSCFVI